MGLELPLNAISLNPTEAILAEITLCIKFGIGDNNFAGSVKLVNINTSSAHWKTSR